MNKPYIKKSHVIMEIMGYVLLIVSLILTIVFSINSNGDIPMQIEFDGTVSRYGDGMALIMLPMVILIVNTSISIIVHLMSADMWNFPVKPRPEKKILLYSYAVSMMMILQLIDAVYTFVIVVSIYMIKATMVPGIATIGLLIGFTIDIVYYIIKMIMDNK